MEAPVFFGNMFTEMSAEDISVSCSEQLVTSVKDPVRQEKKRAQLF